MKFVIVLLLYLNTAYAYLNLQDGKYIGVNEKTGGQCTVTVMMDGSYITYGNIEYHLTILGKGPANDYCRLDEGIEFYACGSGIQVNGDESRSLYIFLNEQSQIQRVEFYDSDFNSLNDKVCLDYKLLNDR